MMALIQPMADLVTQTAAQATGDIVEPSVVWRRLREPSWQVILDEHTHDP